MIKIIITCQYCGNEQVKELYFMPEKKDLVCPVCKESKLLKVKQVENSDVFGYSYSDKKPDAYFKKEEE